MTSSLIKNQRVGGFLSASLKFHRHFSRFLPMKSRESVFFTLRYFLALPPLGHRPHRSVNGGDFRVSSVPSAHRNRSNVLSSLMDHGLFELNRGWTTWKGIRHYEHSPPSHLVNVGSATAVKRCPRTLGSNFSQDPMLKSLSI